MSIDLDVTGNAATTLASRQSCLELSPGDTFTFDVTVEGIPDSRPMIGFTLGLEFEAQLTLGSYEVRHLLASKLGSSILDPGPGISNPQRLYISAVDIGHPGTAEAGSGVLARITLLLDSEAAAGTYSFNLLPESVAIVDTQNNGHTPLTLNNATLVVGGSCPEAAFAPPALTPTPKSPGIARSAGTRFANLWRWRTSRY
jgi:hypothetical protein